MVLEFLGKKYKRGQIKRLIDSENSSVTWTVVLAKVTSELGFISEFYSTSLGFNPKKFDFGYYKKETDDRRFC